MTRHAASRFPKLWMLLVCFSAICLFTGGLAAKRAQYESRDSSTRYLAKAVKMRADFCDAGAAVLPTVSASDMEPPLVVAAVVAPHVTILHFQAFLLPLASRPPPFQL